MLRQFKEKNKNFMGQLPNNVNDIFSINGLTNIINKPTHFDSPIFIQGLCYH
jgi:hypothetical protein